MLKIKLNKTVRNWVILVAILAAIALVFMLRPEQDFSQKYAGVDLIGEAATSATKNYSQYLQEHSGAPHATGALAVSVVDYEPDSTGVSVVTDRLYPNGTVLTEETSTVTWNFTVKEAGFYNIELTYMCVPSRNVNMERILYINGEMPFSGADALTFSRLWKDGGEVKKDNQGNAIRPSQTEFFDYQTVRFKSDLGYEIDPYLFYFKEGENSITLESTNEPMRICGLSLVPQKQIDTYEAYLAKSKTAPNTETKSVYVKVQGENSVARSDPSLFARYDRSSATTEPYSVKNTVLNYSGGDSWKAPGQWVEWEMDIPEDGWYTISIKGRQLYQRGYVACRSVYIDGEIPIQELKSVGFPYSSDWRLNTLSDKNGEPYSFYLTKGTHTIRMEATLGEIGSVISDLQDAIFRLNGIYRTILVLTGTYPDQYRDYEIEKVYPNEVEQMNIESKRLYALVDRFVKVTGQKSNQIAPAETLAVQLEQFYKRPDKITKSFASFKDNITSLGSSLLAMTESKLDVDYIEVQSTNRPIKPIHKNFLVSAKHELVSFITSFLVDTASLGNVYDADAEHTIQVWIVTGRDQSQILKNMVDDSFTPQSGINVNVKLILAESLLNAVVAGNGPDVVISMYSTAPVDYALRNANVDLTRFPDYKEVLAEFKPSGYEAYKYDGGLYALPETETFNLLFYRKDILDQLGVEVPKTWKDLIDILPTLQGNNLSVGIPYPKLDLPDMTTYYSMIYQLGGEIYTDDGMKTIIDSEAGINSFKMYTSFFNDYGLPTIYDPLSRFRMGEMPIFINNYATYNTLVVGAPEIRGLWDFSYLLGTEKEDGTIDRSSVAGTVCTMMIKKGLNIDDLGLANARALVADAYNGKAIDEKLLPGIDERTLNEVRKNETRLQDSWKFMKWWASAETQVRFGRELEAVLGSSARYSTANVEALKQLSWKTAQLEVLLNSLNESVGVPEVPGSYYAPRHVVNAARRVVNEQDDARETLINYTRKINEEILRKRQEFNLPTGDENE